MKKQIIISVLVLFTLFVMGTTSFAESNRQYIIENLIRQNEPRNQKIIIDEEALLFFPARKDETLILLNNSKKFKAKVDAHVVKKNVNTFIVDGHNFTSYKFQTNKKIASGHLIEISGDWKKVIALKTTKTKEKNQFRALNSYLISKKSKIDLDPKKANGSVAFLDKESYLNKSGDSYDLYLSLNNYIKKLYKLIDLAGMISIEFDNSRLNDKQIDRLLKSYAKKLSELKNVAAELEITKSVKEDLDILSTIIEGNFKSRNDFPEKLLLIIKAEERLLSKAVRGFNRENKNIIANSPCSSNKCLEEARSLLINKYNATPYLEFNVNNEKLNSSNSDYRIELARVLLINSDGLPVTDPNQIDSVDLVFNCFEFKEDSCNFILNNKHEELEIYSSRYPSTNLASLYKDSFKAVAISTPNIENFDSFEDFMREMSEIPDLQFSFTSPLDVIFGAPKSVAEASQSKRTGNVADDAVNVKVFAEGSTANAGKVQAGNADTKTESCKFGSDPSGCNQAEGYYCTYRGECRKGDCSQNKDCGEGRFCGPDLVCKDCELDSCGTGKSCIDGKCQDGCRYTIDCGKSQRCESGKCIPTECTPYEKCPQGGVCDRSGSCVDKECMLDSHCGNASASRYCDDGVCKDGCQGTYQCDKGNYCDENHQCTPGCLSNAGCPTCNICTNNICQAIVEAGQVQGCPPGCDSPGSSSGCPTGLTCCENHICGECNEPEPTTEPTISEPEPSTSNTPTPSPSLEPVSPDPTPTLGTSPNIDVTPTPEPTPTFAESPIPPSPIPTSYINCEELIALCQSNYNSSINNCGSDRNQCMGVCDDLPFYANKETCRNNCMSEYTGCAGFIERQRESCEQQC